MQNALYPQGSKVPDDRIVSVFIFGIVIVVLGRYLVFAYLFPQGMAVHAHMYTDVNVCVICLMCFCVAFGCVREP